MLVSGGVSQQLKGRRHLLMSWLVAGGRTAHSATARLCCQVLRHAVLAMRPRLLRRRVRAVPWRWPKGSSRPGQYLQQARLVRLGQAPWSNRAVPLCRAVHRPRRCCHHARYVRPGRMQERPQARDCKDTHREVPGILGAVRGVRGGQVPPRPRRHSMRHLSAGDVLPGGRDGNAAVPDLSAGMGAGGRGDL